MPRDNYKYATVSIFNRVGGKRSSFLPTFVFRPFTPPYVRFRIRRTNSPLAVTFPLSGRFRDLHPLEHVRAGRTKKAVEDLDLQPPFQWSQQGMILRPPDYESGATNQLSYGTVVFVSFERLPRWTSTIQILTTERLLRFEFLVRLASISKYSKNLTAPFHECCRLD